MSETAMHGPAPSGLDRLKTLIADLARPFAIYATSFAASWGIIVVSYRVQDGNDGALYVAAATAGVGAIYIGKSIEVFKTHRASAEVEVARVSAGQVLASGQGATSAPDDGALPEDQRVKL